MQSHYEEFISADNFSLAWERVRYFDRPDSRDWIGLKIFAANRDHNLEILRSSVEERTFEPSWPEIKLFPKPSMTLRPMAILSVNDRIVFQAIGNVIASRGRFKLSTVTNRQSFANVLSNEDPRSFFVHWKRQYRLFQQKFINLIEDGNIWIAETDAAAFYETIDHQLLFEILQEENFLDDDTLEYLMRYLPIWSSVKSGKTASRGVPQGCLTSDLLANIFLFRFDQELAIQEYYYLRYVDDIRLLSRSKEAIQKGLIHVDINLKTLGILLQTKKTTIRRASEDINEETDRLAAQLSEIDSRVRDPERYVNDYLHDPLIGHPTHELALISDEDDIELENEENQVNTNHEDEDLILRLLRQFENEVQEDLKQLFWSSFSAINNNDEGEYPFAERHLRFTLYRLEPDAEITNAIIPFFLERPWLSEVIAFYLRKCELQANTIEFLQNTISNHDVYDSVVAIAIKLFLQKDLPLRSFRNSFRRWIIDEKRHWTLLEVAAQALGESNDNMSILLKGFESQCALIRRMCLIQALRISTSKEESRYIASRLVHDPSVEVSNTLIYLIYNEWDLTLAEIDSGSQILPEHCVRYARGYDQSLPNMEADFIRHTFVNNYRVLTNDSIDFRKLFGTEYRHATKFLWQAENSYLSNPSRYVSQLDLFHEELLYPILVDKLKLKNSKSELAKVEFTNRIEMLAKNKQELTTFAGAIAACRKLRANPETHSRFHRELTYTRSITWRERNGLKRKLSGGYQELIDWMAGGYT